MISRRNFIKNVSVLSAATLLTQQSGANLMSKGATSASATAAPQTFKKFSFGVIADPQYAAVPSNKATRFYANTLWKLEECVNKFNEHDLEFVITLGDIIDKNWTSYDDILPIYDRLKAPNFFVLGNHDYSVGEEYIQSVPRITGLENTYYDFSANKYRFIVLDGNDVSLFAPPKGNFWTGTKDDPRLAIAEKRLAELKAKKAVNAQPWNGSLSDEQFDWLNQVLNDAQAKNESVIVFCHYPVYPENEHNLWDSERVINLLTTYPNVVGYFCGHNHAGNYGKVAGKHFVNFKGMVDTPTTTAYSIVDVSDNEINIRGFGREENKTLAIK